MGSAILVAAACWSAGIGLGGLLDLPWLIVGLAAAASCCAVVLAPSDLTRLAAIALMALLLGYGRASLAVGLPDDDPLTAYAGEVLASGRVLDAPVPRGSRVEAVVELDTLQDPETRNTLIGFESNQPRILLRAQSIRAGFGDRIEMRGRLARPRDRPGWPLARILERRGIGWVLDTGFPRVVEPGGWSLLQSLADARRHFEGNARAVLPEPHASLVAGMVFGARVGLPPDLRAALTTTGTSHLTAVSGANVALVAGALAVVAVRVVGKVPASLIAIVGVWIYTLLVGAPPSALRAATMASLALAVGGLGRQPDSIVGLALAAAGLLAWDPGLAHDLGFQLSVAATAGLILLSPSIERYFGWLPRQPREWIAIALAAQLATLPIVLVTFQRLSLISLPANVLAAPLVAPIMWIGAGLAAAGGLPVVDVLLGWAAWALTSVLLLVIQTCAGVPGALVAVGRPPSWLPIAWYAAYGCWVAAGSSDVRALGIRPSTIGAGAAAGAVTLIVGVLPVSLFTPHAEATQIGLLDLESSTAFVRTPEGRTMLLFTSQPDPGLAASVGGHLDVWESTVDIVIGPDGVESNVDLLAVGQPSDPSISDTPVEDDATGGISRANMPDVGNLTLAPGNTFDAGGVLVLVVDVRQAGQTTAVDLALLIDDLAILLPGPGTPSPYWSSVFPEAITVGRLPSSAVSWARSLPARSWLLLVGDSQTARARGEPGLPLLDRRAYGLVELTVEHGAVGVRTERCEAGPDCRLELPAPTYRTLLTDSPGD